MLSNAYAEIVRRDPTLIGLKTLLDPQAFVTALQPCLPEIINKARLTQLRYTPGTKCLANYSLEMEKNTLQVYAKAHGLDRNVKLQKARKRKGGMGALNQQRVILEDHAIVVSFFPTDSKLKGLRYLDGGKLQKKLLREIFPDKNDFWNCTLETLQYRPELSYVALLRAQSGSQAVLKFYDKMRYERALTNCRAFHSGNHLGIANCVGASERRSTLAFEWFSGRSLSDILASSKDLAMQSIKLTGAALAELHSQHAQGLVARSNEMEASSLLAFGNWLGFVSPRLASRVSRVAREIARLVESEASPNLPIHGDFYSKQVILSNGQAALVDLDEVVLGDPRMDLGLFIANLEYDALCKTFNPNLMSELKEAFLDGWQQSIGKGLPADLDVYISVGLFRLLRRPFRYCQDNWIEETEKILEMAEETIDNHLNKLKSSSSSSGTISAESIVVVDPFNIRQDQKMPFLYRAIDPKEVESVLAHLIGSKFHQRIQISLQSIRVIRYKPNRRCLIEYEMKIRRPDGSNENVILLGKARSKGPDIATYNLCQTLWKSGFDENSIDGVSIPEPIGISAELQMWFQRKVHGSRAIDLLVNGYGDAQLAERIAEAIHKVHQTGILSHRKHTIDDELAILNERLNKVAEMNPILKQRIERLLDNCYKLAVYYSPTETTGIHRDFYHDQVIVDGSRLYLTDFDLYCEGDRALDIGNFKAHLEEYAHRKLGDIKALANVQESFVKRFLHLSGWNRFSVEVYGTLTLVRHISLSTTFPSRVPLVESLLSLSEQRLSSQLSQCKEAPVRNEPH